LEYLSEFIALLALLLSGYATYRSLKFKKSEKELVDVQKKLNQLMLEKEKREATQAKKADLGANFIKVGKHKHRLKVFNKGKATAYNVNIEFPEGNDLILEHDLEEKFPLEIMERGQSVDLVAAFDLQSKSKLKVKLSWENEREETDEKILYSTI
jgi:hypothetical protein